MNETQVGPRLDVQVGQLMVYQADHEEGQSVVMEQLLVRLQDEAAVKNMPIGMGITTEHSTRSDEEEDSVENWQYTVIPVVEGLRIQLEELDDERSTNGTDKDDACGSDPQSDLTRDVRVD